MSFGTFWGVLCYILRGVGGVHFAPQQGVFWYQMGSFLVFTSLLAPLTAALFLATLLCASLTFMFAA